MEENEKEILQKFKKELEASKKRSIILMRERVNPQEALSAEEMIQREQEKGLMVEDTQALLAFYIEQYDLIRESIISELEIQKDIKYQEENTKNRRRRIKGEIRTDKRFLTKLDEKLSILVEWIMTDAMAAYNKEKDRANLLLQRAAEFRLTEAKKQSDIKRYKKSIGLKLSHGVSENESALKKIRDKADQLEASNLIKSKEIEALRAENERLNNRKRSIISSRIANEQLIKSKEEIVINEALSRAFEKSALKQAENLDFTDAELENVFQYTLII